MNFYSIEIKHNQDKITLKPIKCFRISDDYNRIVLTYEITYELGFIIRHKSFINYYLSDGNTNKLRANMLYPIMCYHQLDDTSCIKANYPYSQNYKLIVKIGGIKNIYLGKINEEMLSEIKYKIHHEKHKSLDDSDKLILDYLRIYKSTIYPIKDIDKTKFNYLPEASIGLISVVSRIENLLDLIIALYSEPLINLKSIEHYKPIPVQYYINHNIDPSDFTKTFKNLGLKDDIITGFDEYIDENLRESLLNKLNNIIKLLVNTKLFNVNTIILESETITKKIFNDKYAQICKDNEINLSKKKNFKNYFIISKKLLEIMSKKMNNIINNYTIEICKTSRDQSFKKKIAYQLYSDKINNLNNLKSMLLTETLYGYGKLVNEEDYLSRIIESWGTCNKN